ncbi:putative metalloprotease CJM1_0395 family protein [Chitinibacteraceae bacterium HSL-7]
MISTLSATGSASSAYTSPTSKPADQELATSSYTYAYSNTESAKPGQTLSEDAQAAVNELAGIDRKVRQHEQAHRSAAAGVSTSAPSFKLVTGPDGRSYAVAGEVRIDVSPGRDAEETLRRARIIQAAALAPADPSPADRAVAQRAQAMEAAAQQEIAQQSSGQRDVRAAYRNETLPASTFSTSA